MKLLSAIRALGGGMAWGLAVSSGALVLTWQIINKGPVAVAAAEPPAQAIASDHQPALALPFAPRVVDLMRRLPQPTTAVASVEGPPSARPDP
jgi:hypothetical protein